MIFQANIDNDSVALLPAARFSGRVVVVDRDEMVDAACDDLQRFERIGRNGKACPERRRACEKEVKEIRKRKGKKN